MLITAKLLQSMSACDHHYRLFVEKFPHGFDTTIIGNYHTAYDCGLDMDWFVEMYLVYHFFNESREDFLVLRDRYFSRLRVYRRISNAIDDLLYGMEITFEKLGGDGIKLRSAVSDAFKRVFYDTMQDIERTENLLKREKDVSNNTITH